MNKTVFVGLMIVSTIGLSRPAYAYSHELPQYFGWVGPHFNINFGENGVESSVGLEASMWYLSPSLTYEVLFGADLGVEYNFTREVWIRYGELQVGQGLAGLSVGLVSDDDHGYGLQGSLWANMIGGGMFRVRRFGGIKPHKEVSLGIYIKAPYMGVY